MELELYHSEFSLELKHIQIFSLTRLKYGKLM